MILAGDICCEQQLAVRSGLAADGHARGTCILIGDPGRTYFPRAGLFRLADYHVPTTRELEDREIKRAEVFTVPA